MRNIGAFFAFSVIALVCSGCTATGDRFSGLESPKEDQSIVYLMRKSKFSGGAYCPPVTIDAEKIGCLKNGGYLLVRIEPGVHELRFEKRLLESGKEQFINFEILPGQTLFFEWVTATEDVMLYGPTMFGITFSEGIIQHDRKSAKAILENMKES